MFTTNTYVLFGSSTTHTKNGLGGLDWDEGGALGNASQAKGSFMF